MRLSRTLLLILPLTFSYSVQSPLPSASSFEEEDSEESSEEGPFLEGDIVIGTESIPVIDFRSHVQRNLVAEPRLLWPDKRVFYDFSGNFPSSLKVHVSHALDDVMAQTCVKFEQRSGQKTYLKLRATGKGCATKVGFQQGTRGPLDLHVGGRKCHTRGTIQHEFMHALGFWHEHTRPDRDRFVKVHWENVRPGRESNFVIRLSNESASLGLPYDFASVMHYKQTAFGRKKGEVTLEPIVMIKEARKVMGQRRGVTKLDIAKLNRLYNCTGGPPGATYYRAEELKGMDVVIGEVEEPEPKEVVKRGEEKMELRGKDVVIGGVEGPEPKKDVKRGEEKMELKGKDVVIGGLEGPEPKEDVKRGEEKMKLKGIDVVIKESEKPEQKEGVKRGEEKMELKGRDVVIGGVEKREPKEDVKRGEEKMELKGKVIGEVEKPEPKDIVTDKMGNVTLKVTKTEMIEEVIVSRSLEKLADVESPGDSERDCTLKSANNESGEEKSKFKRQAMSLKPMDEKGGVPQAAQHESFAPQKILPELLKGVLDKENDRPIVIQFAIYQPIVYKTVNESEENKKMESKPSTEQSVVDTAGSKRKPESSVAEDDLEKRSGFGHDDIDLRSFDGGEDYHDRRNDKPSGNVAPKNFEIGLDPSRDYVRQQLPEMNSAKVPFKKIQYSSSTQTDDGHEEERLIKTTKTEYSRPPPKSEERYSFDHGGEYIPNFDRREFDDHLTFPSKENIQPLQAKKNDYPPSGRVNPDRFPDIKSDDYLSSRVNTRSEPQESVNTKQISAYESNRRYSDFPSSTDDRFSSSSYDNNHKDQLVSHTETEGHFDTRHVEDADSHNIPSASEDHHFSSDHESFYHDSQPKEHLEEVTTHYVDSHDYHDTKNDNREFLVIDHKREDDVVPIKLGKNGPLPQDYADSNQQPKEKQDKNGSRNVRVKFENVAPDWKGDVESSDAQKQNNFRKEDNQNADRPSEGNSKFDATFSSRERVKPRPDLSLEEDFNDKLDQERRKKLMEKEETVSLPLPTTNAQKPREARVNIVRTLSSKAIPVRRTIAKNPKRDLQDEMPPDPEESVEDDILITKQMVNLYPRQALPLKACVNMEALQAKMASR